MGLIPGLMAAGITSYKDTATIIKAEVLVVVAAAVGMLVPSLLEIPLGGIDFRTAIVGYWFPAALSNAINGLVLVPILMVAYDAVVSRSGR
jgi:energy-coupling factor transport system substrate-specific component